MGQRSCQTGAEYFDWRRAGWIVALHLIGFALLALAGCGEMEQRQVTSLDHPFHGRGSGIDWAEWIATGLAIAIPLFIVLGHILQRRASWIFASNTLLFMGVVALPLFMWVVGGFATYEGAKSVEFCHSCHEPMDMYVEDMLDPASTNLAAVHYKNRLIQEDQCFTCHADYGVFGGLEAKMTGLFHLYHWIMRSPTGTGKAQIQLYHPYPNTFCLHCHAGSQKFLEADDGTHADLGDSLLNTDPKTGAPETSCLDCHGPPHPSWKDWQAKKEAKSK